MEETVSWLGMVRTAAAVMTWVVMIDGVGPEM
jgi:hypothetical protein